MAILVILYFISRDLSNNNLTGTIPSLASTKTAIIDLRNNMFNGQIPTSLSQNVSTFNSQCPYDSNLCSSSNVPSNCKNVAFSCTIKGLFIINCR